ncbi:MAG: peptidylprolyl isomerase, partial [Roseibacillus sp.]
MNPFTLGLLALLAAAPTIPAQIYADFTVSHGDTPLGTFRVRLDHDKAPRPVAAFIGLATGQRNWVDLNSGSVMSNTPYYDGQIFHRLDHDFVLQGGDQLGTGGGGPGYVFQDQYHADLRHDRYILSMAKTGDPNTNGSQFFIVLADESTPASFAAAVALDDLHSVFGEVINDATYPNSRTLIDNFADPALFPTNGERPQTP